MAGLFCTLIFLKKDLLWVSIGFIIFRILDIMKPFPIRRLEKRLEGGYGIVLDDIVSAIYANILLLLLEKSNLFFGNY